MAEPQAGFLDNPSNVNMLVQMLSALGQGFDPNNPMVQAGKAAAQAGAAGESKCQTADAIQQIRQALLDPDDQTNAVIGKGGGATLNIAGPAQGEGGAFSGGELSKSLIASIFGGGDNLDDGGSYSQPSSAPAFHPAGGTPQATAQPAGNLFDPGVTSSVLSTEDDDARNRLLKLLTNGGGGGAANSPF